MLFRVPPVAGRLKRGGRTLSARGFEFAPSMHVIVAGEPTAETLAVANTLRKSGLSCVCLPNCRTFIEHARYLKPDVILLDEGHADEFLRKIGAHEDIRAVPMIRLVSPDAESRARAFAAGALDCIVKPILDKELLARLSAHLELRALRKRLDLGNMQFATTLDAVEGIASVSH
ncbi:response regulator [Ensifer aridi]|uniref:response regulator n=1 Tax=Ensifer aridi TaxID=1708715 RepID=UPI0011116E1C|nr:response regulator [Ensifer aridi]